MLTLAVFLGILGTKLYFIENYGSDLPYWDQWSGEGRLTFMPWFEKGDWWSPLLTLHNEHRIAPTRLLCLILMTVGGQWDARVQCVVNAGIHAATIALFFWWAQSYLTRGWCVALAGFLVAVFAPPIVSENLLAGFQSQFYFLIFFSVAGIWLLLAHRALSLRWWLGFASALVVIVTMGSGFLCGPAIVVVALARLCRPDAVRRDVWLTVAAGTVVSVMGAYCYTPAPHLDFLRSHSVAEFLNYAMRGLSWPAFGQKWLWAIFWAPWAAVAVRWFNRRRARHDPVADFIVATGLWILVQTAAVSYSRGGGSILPSNRYGEVTGLGLPLGFASLGLLLSHGAPRPWRYASLIHAGIGVLALGIATRQALHTDLPLKRAENREFERNVRELLLTNDPEAVRGRRIPYPTVEELHATVNIPQLRAILPASVQVPLPVPGFADRDYKGLGGRPFHRVAPGTRWESAPLPAGTGGWWVIETSGDIGQPGTSLRLVARATGTTLATIAPSKLPGTTWRAAYLPAPQVPAVLVAEAKEASSFSFSQPVVMSSLSYRAWRFTKAGIWLALLGILGIAGAGLALLKKREVSALSP